MTLWEVFTSWQMILAYIGIFVTGFAFGWFILSRYR